MAKALESILCRNMRKDTKYLFVNEKKLQWDNYNKKNPCKTGLVKY